MMKIIRFLSFLLIFLLQSCFPAGPTESIKEEAEVDLAGTKWVFSNKSGFDASIEFSKDLKQVSGYDGCNSFSADLELKNFLMELSKFVSTERYCEDLSGIDRDYLVALSKVRDYQVTNDRLTLYTLGSVFIGKRNTTSLRYNLIKE